MKKITILLSIMVFISLLLLTTCVIDPVNEIEKNELNNNSEFEINNSELPQYSTYGYSEFFPHAYLTAYIDKPSISWKYDTAKRYAYMGSTANNVGYLKFVMTGADYNEYMVTFEIRKNSKESCSFWTPDKRVYATDSWKKHIIGWNNTGHVNYVMLTGTFRKDYSSVELRNLRFYRLNL